jgi:hypothetical protein
VAVVDSIEPPTSRWFFPSPWRSEEPMQEAPPPSPSLVLPPLVAAEAGRDPEAEEELLPTSPLSDALISRPDAVGVAVDVWEAPTTAPPSGAAWPPPELQLAPARPAAANASNAPWTRIRQL